MLSGVPKSGAKPHPIRKKAFHRALTAGKLWIIVPYSKADLVVFKLSISSNLLTFAKVLPDRNLRDYESFITWPMDWVSQTIKLEMK
jgi:hypothetical protein